MPGHAGAVPTTVIVADALQDTFLAAWPGVRGWDGSGDPAPDWRLAIRRRIGQLCTRQRWASVGRLDDIADITAAAYDQLLLGPVSAGSRRSTVDRDRAGTIRKWSRAPTVTTGGWPASLAPMGRVQRFVPSSHVNSASVSRQSGNTSTGSKDCHTPNLRSGRLGRRATDDGSVDERWPVFTIR